MMVDYDFDRLLSRFLGDNLQTATLRMILYAAATSVVVATVVSLIV